MYSVCCACLASNELVRDPDLRRLRSMPAPSLALRILLRRVAALFPPVAAFQFPSLPRVSCSATRAHGNRQIPPCASMPFSMAHSRHGRRLLPETKTYRLVRRYHSISSSSLSCGPQGYWARALAWRARVFVSASHRRPKPLPHALLEQCQWPGRRPFRTRGSPLCRTTQVAQSSLAFQGAFEANLVWEICSSFSIDYREHRAAIPARLPRAGAISRGF